MTYTGFLKNLDARGAFRIRPNLSRIRKVLRLLHNPQDQFPSIHIAGTNGKGSVAAGLEAVLRANGYRTGLYTSPHLVDLRERIQLNGIPISKGFVRTAEKVLKAEARAGVSLTYFELLTAIAFQTFAQNKIDIGIIECGMGGLWDATNVMRKPLISVITSIGLDHTDWLGQNEFQIATQKAGIIKRLGMVISGVRGQAANAIEQAARQKNAKIQKIDLHFRAETISTSWHTGKQTISFLYNGEPLQTIPFGLLGTHQADNAALVVAALRQLKNLGWTFSVQQRDKALNEIHWPARLELIHRSKSVPILLDGAHNPQAVQALLKAIESSPFKNVPKTFVFSAYKDKDYHSMAQMISRLAAEVCLCPLPGNRGTSTQQLRAAFTSVRGPVRLFKSSQEALRGALQDTPRQGLVVVTGSLALIGEISSVVVPMKTVLHA